MKRVFYVALFLLVASAFGADKPDEYFDADVQCLIKTKVFSFGGIGFAGSISEGEVAFGRIVRKKDSIRYLLAAFEHGSDYSRCYALVGLRETSPKFYRAALAWFRQNGPESIKTISGCIGDEKPTAIVLNDIDGGRYTEFFRKHESRAR